MKSYQILFYINFTYYITFICSVRILVKPEIMKREFPYPNDVILTRDWSNECDVPCVWTGQTEKADAVFYMMMNNGDAILAFRDKKIAPISIGGSTEGTHYYSHLTNKEFWQHFNASALLATDADIPWITKVSSFIEMQKVKLNPNPIKKAAVTLYNCNSKNSRERLIMEMGTILEIDRLGKCLNNHPWPKCGDRYCNKEEALRMYALCLAFENGNSPGYVTEKIHQCFRAGSLPVYYGDGAVRKYVPKRSYIDLADFPSQFALAEYLVKVLKNDSLYKSYFEWKNKPLDPDFIWANKPFWDYKVYCRVCRYVLVKKKGLTWDKKTQMAVENQPKEFIQPQVVKENNGIAKESETQNNTDSPAYINPIKESNVNYFTQLHKNTKRFIETSHPDFFYLKTFIQASLLFTLIIILYILTKRGVFNWLLMSISSKSSFKERN